MTFLVSPEMQLEIAGKQYTLSPAMECLKKIQHYTQKDIIALLDEIPKMSFDKHAKIIEIAIADYGETPPKIEVIEQWIVDEAGITAIRNVLVGWLLLITTPKREREEMQRIVGEGLRALGI